MADVTRCVHALARDPNRDAVRFPIMTWTRDAGASIISEGNTGQTEADSESP